jgi:Cu/Ag efflux pump CusA
VQVNVRGRDVGSYVAEAQRKIAARVSLPSGRYRIEWGGQFEHYERARNRLIIVVPLVRAMIFALLYVTYRSVADALRVYVGVPFAIVGGVLSLWVRDMPFSISAGVGFIALSGVAVLGKMVLVSYVRQLPARGLPVGLAIEEAAMTRLRPVLMTALVASLGFLPMALSSTFAIFMKPKLPCFTGISDAEGGLLQHPCFCGVFQNPNPMCFLPQFRKSGPTKMAKVELSTGVGAEVQRPLATVVVGGVISSTLLTLLVLPAIYLVFGVSAARPLATQEEDSLE